MAIKGLNRVFVTTSSTGSGTPFVCSATAAATGYRTLAQEATDGASYFYGRWDQTSGAFEEGYGSLVLATRTITPTVIIRSSNGVGTPVNWSGTQNVIFAAGQGGLLHPQNNLSDVGNATTSRNNLSAELAFAGSGATKWPFCQAAAPTGWTQTSDNDKVLRVVNGAGGGTGGSWTISGLAVSGHVLTVAEMPNHTHDLFYATVNLPTSGGSPIGIGNLWNADPGGGTRIQLNVGTAGGDGSHTHSLTADGAWRPAYINIILCSKN